MVEEKKKIIGRAENIDLPTFGFFGVPAKIDTGAKTSSIWATDVQEQDGVLTFVLFGKGSPLYTGEQHRTVRYEKTVVASSIGAHQERYKVQIVMKVRGKRIRASFTLADRSQQAYPVLIGRSALRGKFVVDVQSGQPDYKAEKNRHLNLRSEQEQQS